MDRAITERVRASAPTAVAEDPTSVYHARICVPTINIALPTDPVGLRCQVERHDGVAYKRQRWEQANLRLGHAYTRQIKPTRPTTTRMRSV